MSSLWGRCGGTIPVSASVAQASIPSFDTYAPLQVLKLKRPLVHAIHSAESGRPAGAVLPWPWIHWHGLQAAA